MRLGVLDAVFDSERVPVFESVSAAEREGVMAAEGVSVGVPVDVMVDVSV